MPVNIIGNTNKSAVCYPRVLLPVTLQYTILISKDKITCVPPNPQIGVAQRAEKLTTYRKSCKACQNQHGQGTTGTGRGTADPGRASDDTGNHNWSLSIHMPDMMTTITSTTILLAFLLSLILICFYYLCYYYHSVLFYCMFVCDWSALL